MADQQRMVIDGYNVIFADPELKGLAARDLEKARGTLVEWLRAYLARKNLAVTVVFDGRGSMVEEEVILPGKLQVVFSRGFESADEFILVLLRESHRPQAYLVVSSDQEHIGREAGRMGARVIASKSFLSRIRPKREARSEKGEKPNPEGDDLDYWLRKFGMDEEEG